MMEIRDLNDDEKEQQWSKKAREYEDRIAKLLNDVQWAETSAEVDAQKQPVQNIDNMTAKQMTTQALAVQEKTQESVMRAKQVLEETIEIGTAVNQELKSQGEQMGKIQQDVEQVETNLKRANKQLRVFMRRMATDKIFILFIFLIVVGIIVAIVLFVLKQRGIILKSS
ncbi:hypothetical protein HK102_012814 [Quaeritorhiza haematococci]|nr:hypothetical protein HK102_012814 [Quaeritorhiza haematococci]